MERQRKGDCGHIMASVDPHGLCVRCRECDLVNAPCSVCLAMTSVQREAAQLAYARRRHCLQRRKDRASSVCSSSSEHSSGSVWTDPPRNPLSLDGERLGQLPPRAVVARLPLRNHGRRTAALMRLRLLPRRLHPRSPRYGEMVARDPGHPIYVGGWPGKRLSAGAD